MGAAAEQGTHSAEWWTSMRKMRLRMANWCPHCTETAPLMNQVARDMAQEKDVDWLKIDASKIGEVRRAFAVKSYPTIQFFKQEQAVSEFEPDPTVQDLESWAKTQHAKHALLEDPASRAASSARASHTPRTQHREQRWHSGSSSRAHS